MRRTAAVLATHVGLVAFAAVAALGAAASPAAADSAADLATALADPQKLPRRVHIAAVGNVGLTADSTIDETDHRTANSYDDVPIVAVRPGRVRIVIDDDDARLLLWIDEKDLAWAIAAETRITGKGDVGVWLLAGARVTATGTGPRRRVSTTFNSGVDVSLSGTVPATSLTRVFTPPPAPPGFAGEQHAPSLLLEPGGKRIPGLPNGLSVHIISSGRGDWRLVEHTGRWLRVRGWVRNRDLESDLGTIGTGGGGSYGMNHTDRVDIPAGTCLFASPAGEVIGVQLTPSTRYTTSHDAGWWSIYIGIDWGLFLVSARSTGVDRAKKPMFATCP